MSRLKGLLAPRKLERDRASERGLGLLDNHVEGGFVVNGELGELLTVHVDACKLEAGNEAAVGQIARAAGRIKADDPQLAELGLLLAAVTVGVLTGFDYAINGVAIQAGAIPELAGSGLEETLVLFERRNCVC